MTQDKPELEKERAKQEKIDMIRDLYKKTGSHRKVAAMCGVAFLTVKKYVRDVVPDNNERISKVVYNSSGKAKQKTPRLNLSNNWCEQLGINEREREVKVTLDNNRIIIEKYNEQKESPTS